MKIHQANSLHHQPTRSNKPFERVSPILRKCIHRHRCFPERRPKHQVRRREELYSTIS